MDWLAPYWPAFMAAYTIQIVGVLSPGPAVALILGVGAEQGRRAALVSAAGIATGAGCLAFGTLLGLGLLIERVAWAAIALRWLGAAYLGWLAWRAFGKALRPPRVVVGDVPPTPLPRLFTTALLLQLTNVKALVFWMAAVSVGPAQTAPMPVMLAFAAGGTLLSFAGHGLYAVLLSSRPVRAAYNRARRWIEAALGGFLALMALRMATERG